MSNLQGKQLVVGISGGIAAYKSAELVRLLIQAGVQTRVCMTRSATEFITPLTLQALSGNPVHTELFDLQAEAAMGHIELGRWAEAIVIAPASADLIARLAHGFASDLLTTLCLASEAPVFLAPAMNRVMWSNPATQANIAILQQRGFQLLGPAEGEQACGETGLGRMMEPVAIFSSLEHLLSQKDADDELLLSPLENSHILITAGPTREAIDPVRYISNRSSGKMGYALAQAAADLGARVTLISGPVSLAPPCGISCVNVETASQMLEATLKQAVDADIFIATAAVADYAPEHPMNQKIKKTANTMALNLKRNPDILATVSEQYPDLFCVGFAAETEKLLEYAEDKLKRKKLDMIIANPVGDNQGFDQETNQVEILWQSGHISLPEQTKPALARAIMNIIARHLRNDSVIA